MTRFSTRPMPATTWRAPAPGEKPERQHLAHTLRKLHAKITTAIFPFFRFTSATLLPRRGDTKDGNQPNIDADPSTRDGCSKAAVDDASNRPSSRSRRDAKEPDAERGGDRDRDSGRHRSKQEKNRDHARCRPAWNALLPL